MPPSAPHPSMAVIDSDIYTRDDIRTLMRTAHPNPDPIPIESGGDSLAATFSPGTGRPDHPCHRHLRRSGHSTQARAGVGRADLLVVNKTDLAPHVGVDTRILESDARGGWGAPHHGTVAP